MHTQPLLRFRRGISLIEILVVVSIIAVLLAILLPSLQKASEAQERTLCATNLHQWGIGVRAYTIDNSKFFPYNGNAVTINNFCPVGGDDTSWCSTVVQKFWENYLKVKLDANLINSNANNVLFCPTNEWHPFAIKSWNIAYNRGLIGYCYLPSRNTGSMNYTLAGGDIDGDGSPDGNGWVGKLKIDGFNSRAPIMMDLIQADSGNWFYNQTVPYANHRRDTGEPWGGNFLFEDGHTSWYDWADIGIGGTNGGWAVYYDVAINR
ncbi:MAG: prepilin-type N-terminal cleavage/methylation domain-containing protein [Phycisphaera sp.]|nr:prepilin-type N-terminal cleavage/methylation domain-containing protein [Phycisphaera sp.]